MVCLGAFSIHSFKVYKHSAVLVMAADSDVENGMCI